MIAVEEMGVLCLDGSKYSDKIRKSKVFNVIKTKLIIYDFSSEQAPVSDWEITVYPTLIYQGSRYVGVKPILTVLEEIAQSSHKKPLF